MADTPRAESLFQDVMSQFPALNGHTQLLIGFQLTPETPRSSVVEAIKGAIAEMVTQIPWLGGQVAREGGSAGILKPAPWPADAPENLILRVKDCKDLLPSMAELLYESVPIERLDSKLLSPFPGLSEGHKLSPPVPIVALQANFLENGLILTMCFHHIVMDGTAAVQFILHLATILNGGRLSSADIEQANRDRSSVVKLLSRSEPVKDHSHLRRPPGFMYQAPESAPTWCLFKIPASRVAVLKREASSQSQLISENDALCAFCWQRISAIRLARGGKQFTSSTISQFHRPIDVRPVVGVPMSYMGHVVCHAIARLRLGELVSAPLHKLAQLLRRELNAANNEWAVRSYATFVAREPDKSTLLYGGVTNPNTDLGATSTIIGSGDWPLKFGPALGVARFFRRPRSTPIPGSISISMVEDGSVPIALCLPEKDIIDLKKDSEWRRYMKHVG
ncbi:hypothetical protein SUNI508_11989 [Seiridium unicorne]|uniref:Trichothecene 3-O-acetyltransferase-like N-terminal domain-containing protein n=1 Tax=Seiridium unicorne TaxID=138068 RepID=A0ABR2UF06_9PEZI